MAIRIGGISALAIGMLYIVIIILYSTVGALPAGGEEKLQYLVGKTNTWWAIVGLSVFTNFLYVLVSIALYLALKNVNHIMMLIGVALINLFAILENAVSWTNHGALIILSQGFVSATTDHQRSMFVSAATYASSVLDSPLSTVWAIGTVALGILIIGSVMVKSEFGRFTASVGIAAGILGIIAVAGLRIAVIPHVLLTTVWLFLTGFKLYRLSFTSSHRTSQVDG